MRRDGSRGGFAGGGWGCGSWLWLWAVGVGGAVCLGGGVGQGVALLPERFLNANHGLDAPHQQEQGGVPATRSPPSLSFGNDFWAVPTLPASRLRWYSWPRSRVLLATSLLMSFAVIFTVDGVHQNLEPVAAAFPSGLEGELDHRGAALSQRGDKKAFRATDRLKRSIEAVMVVL